MAIENVLEKFAARTTMHGVPKVIHAKSTMGRVFWSIICITAGSMFCLQMSEVLHRYFSYPKKVTVEVVPTAVPFPSISICNMRNLDVHVLNSLNRMFLEDDRPYNNINKTDNRFIKAYMTQVAKYAPLFWEYQEKYPEVFQEIFSRTTFSANIDEQVISEVAVQLEGFVVNCHYAGHRCNKTRDFIKFFDPYYFNCFTYTAPGPKEIDDSLAEGIENGWSSIVLSGSGMLDKNAEIRMLPGLHEWRSAVSASEGVRVVIHPPNTNPYPFTEGYDVPPGFSASFGIHLRKNIRMGPPHGNCSNIDRFGDGTKRYRLMSCQKMCMQIYIVEQCGCADVGLPVTFLPSNVTLCRDNQNFPEKCIFEASTDCLDSMMALHSRIQCARSTKASITKNTTAMEQCACFPPCDEISYDVSYSLSKWPAAGYEGDAAFFDVFGIEKFNERFNKTETLGKYKLFQEYFNVSDREKTMKDFARLNVYIADSNVVKTQESQDYTRNQLVSDIGGQLGLWVGISIITLAEVLELLVDLFRFLSVYSKHNHQKSKTAVDKRASFRKQNSRNNNHVLNGSLDYDPNHKRDVFQRLNSTQYSDTAYTDVFDNGFTYEDTNDETL